MQREEEREIKLQKCHSIAAGPRGGEQRAGMYQHTYLSVLDVLHVTDESQQPLTQVDHHGTNHPHPSLFCTFSIFLFLAPSPY